MHVFKFGGASVKDAAAVRNMIAILDLYPGIPLVIVISAMHKSTNLLEDIHKSILNNDGNTKTNIDIFVQFHYHIIDELSLDNATQLKTDIVELFKNIAQHIDYKDALYSQIVAIGELASTLIITAYLKQNGFNAIWVDVRTLIKTTHGFRNGRVDWIQTEHLIKSNLSPLILENALVITQGFIASNSTNQTTTLGREGSDYSAAIFAYCLHATSMIIWKDVMGVFNADPKKYPKAIKLDEVSFHDAIELAYYGASVIHPRTLQPLQRKGIPMWVKSFTLPKSSGTLISRNAHTNIHIPFYINQPNEWIITIATRDLSFIIEEHMSRIFDVFSRHQVPIDLMQNSAICFTLAVHHSKSIICNLITELQETFDVEYTNDNELITIRHFNTQIIETLTTGREIIITQRTPTTYRALLK